ncbi:hypothetical protein IWW37_005180 [Coemansia sp. RSA 2050]|nr:hypothetical protein IWW37_005180 [Coemansia sp. RSA 2050]KAJ2732094.1 hypothetical protein IW152_004074 [Coemansia sp. BCRC 34962]
MTTRRSVRLVAKTAETTAAALPASKAAAKASKVTKERTRKPRARKSSAVAIGRAASTTATAVAAAPPSSFPFPSLATPQVMEDALRHLKSADPKLGKFIDKTVEQCAMSLDRDQDGHTSYISLCQSIIYQQLAGKAAAAILLRFLKRYGKLKDESKAELLTVDGASLDSSDFIFPTPEQVAAIDTEELKNAGLGQRKAEYLKEVAKKFNDGTLSDEKLARMSDSEAAAALVAIRGIGPWTADMFLMFHLKRTNILPTLDLAVRKAMCHHFGVPFGKKTPTHEHMVEMGQIWEPYRSVATWYMWKLSGTITQKS